MSKILFGKEYAPAVVEAIESAEHEIFVFMFDWRVYSSSPSALVSSITQALVRAQRRGVRIWCIVNYPSVVEPLRELGFSVRRHTERKIMHAKAVIFDRSKILIGSHNFTHNAMVANLEVSLFFEDIGLAGRLSDFFMATWQQSQ